MLPRGFVLKQNKLTSSKIKEVNVFRFIFLVVSLLLISVIVLIMGVIGSSDTVKDSTLELPNTHDL